MKYPKIAKLNSVDIFRQHLADAQIDIPLDETVETGSGSPLARPLDVHNMTLGNRFCILPMEGWDGTNTGQPTELTRRRWRNFGRSGAKLIWGGEAVAVRPDGRANPNQLMINDSNLNDLEQLRLETVEAHANAFERTDDLSIGLQLTHSGRFARPNTKDVLEPAIAYVHPVLDQQIPADTKTVLSDDDLRNLIDDFAKAAKLAAKAGFDWVDIKHCHGYLGHELLSAWDRPGDFGGSFGNRTRFLREVVAAISSESSQLRIAVRVSIFDFVPFIAGQDLIGRKAFEGRYNHAWGGDGTGEGVDLREPLKFMSLLQELGIQLVGTTAGSPYYCPHIQRPASFPPSDGYLPPEDPLAGVARQMHATAELKRQFPNLVFVGSGYSFLQDWLPNVAQAAVRSERVDAVGLGRMVLSYPELPADVLAGKPLQRKRICRTFSDCTTAPRNGLVSGCYPLDEHYSKRPEYVKLKDIKRAKQN